VSLDGGRRAARLPTRTAAAASAAVAVGTTLSLGWAVGALLPALLGVVAGLALAGAARAGSPGRRVPLLSGALAAVGGLLGVAGIAAITLSYVPWPPVPPVPFLPFAPFLALFAGGVAGFGGAATARDLPPAAAGPAGARAAAVATVPLAAAVAASGGAPAAAVVGLVAVGVAVVGIPYLDAPTAVCGGGLVVAVAATYRPAETFAVGAAATETRRQFLVETAASVGALAVLSLVVAAALALAALFLLSIRLAAATGLLGEGAGLQVASAGAFLSAVAAGIAGTHPVVAFCGVAASLLAWDLGEFGTTLGREVGRDGTSRRAELVHAVGGLALAGLAAGAALAIAVVVSTVPASGATAVAAAGAAVGTVLLVVASR
jgi:hypothetical protein